MSLVKQVIAEALDILFPPTCPACGRPSEILFCPACEDGLERSPGPVLPGPDDDFEIQISPFVYGGPLARAVVRFKHGDVPALGSRLAAAGLAAAPPPACDLAIPVPLHPHRLASRGFNPAGILARRVARAAGALFSPGLLRRIRDTPSQGGLSAAGRAENVRSAFACMRPLEGRSIVLVDDVWTTGATARACAAALAQRGGSRIVVWTLARVE